MNPIADDIPEPIRAAEKKNRSLAILAARAAHERRAEDILVLDVRGLAEYADYFVLASASSLSRVRGVLRLAEKRLAKAGGRAVTRPESGSGWALADFGDVIVHIFDDNARAHYRLEDLWGDAPRVDWEKRAGREREGVGCQ